ncbi:reverse transcriptase-like protein [Enterococcus casseliflavus]|uniref:reverse transcriptase-like protein n=1 Tax=Enterococcus casseliflavus TaxID=37734 RepID=UPI0039A5E119
MHSKIEKTEAGNFSASLFYNSDKRNKGLKQLTGYIDGSVIGNDDFRKGQDESLKFLGAGCSYQLLDNDTLISSGGSVLETFYEFRNEIMATNCHIPEFEGVYLLLSNIKEMFDSLDDIHLVVKTDSQTVIEHLYGSRLTNNPIQARIKSSILGILYQLDSFELEYIPRRENHVCDSLAKEYSKMKISGKGTIK